MLPFWMRFNMATLTIKNLPDELYQALSQTAKKHRRSINSEAIVRLERSLSVQHVDLDEIRALRKKTMGLHLTDKILEQAKNEGRP